MKEGFTRIAIDFDQTLSTVPENQEEDEAIGEPIDGAVEALEHLHDLGYELIIFTARKDLLPVRNWLEEHVFSEIERFPLPVTNKKEPSDFYIDDKAIRFNSWEESLAKIEEYDAD